MGLFNKLSDRIVNFSNSAFQNNKNIVFFAVLILLIIVIFGISLLGKIPNTSIKKTLTKPKLSSTIKALNTSTYRNDTYGIEFQYDKNSIIIYERKDGKTYINGKLVGNEYKQHAVDESGPIIELAHPFLVQETSEGKKRDDKLYFTLEIRPREEGCDHWVPKEKQTVKKINSINYLYTEFYGAYNAYYRRACTIHGDYTWVFATSVYYKNHMELNEKLFNQILFSFKFLR
jgi:hypothetical protein